MGEADGYVAPMSPELAIVAAAALLASAIITGLIRQFGLRWGVLDVPNERSSHQTPTPRGGGLAVVIAMSCALCVLAWRHLVPPDLLVALLGGGVAVAVVGFLDDRRRLSAGVRLAVHAGAAIWALAWLGGLPPLQLGERVVVLGWPGQLLGLLGIVWVLNLFNFMDGIDGIAASEAIFVAWCGGLLVGSASTGAAAWVLGAACLGFLCWNWPPARIFLGDVGSGYLGYALAVLALAMGRDNPVAIPVWLILGGVFFADATVTLLRRLRRGEQPHLAHRSHAYQQLARRWGSHLRVTGTVLLANLLWLLPCAAFAVRHPRYAAWATVVALIPLVALALLAGAGRAEGSGPTHP
jgi:Fuc2NAc and GlcNAc transferase